MRITREYLEQQIAQLRAQQDQHMASANACTGAIQMCERLLAELEKPEPARDEDTA